MTPVKDGKEVMSIKWPVVQPPGPGATVGQRVEYSIAQALRSLFASVDEPLAELLSWPLRLLVKVVEASTASYMGPAIDHALTVMDPDDPFRGMLAALRNPTGEGAAGLLTGMGAGMGQAGLMSVFEPLFESARQRAYDSRPSKIYDLPTWVSMSWRGLPPDVDLVNVSRRSGYRGAWLPQLIEVLRPRPALGELGVLTQRKVFTVDQFRAELQARGYTSQDSQSLSQLLQVIPAIPDLIRMAVREAFSPDIVDRFQLLAEFPTQMTEWAEKLGLTQEWSQRYWAAHWELPSVTMGFEMFHRGIMSGEELDLLLRTLDISPFWRGKLRELSFNPLTRVDVRRMYSLGVLDEGRVYKSYLDLGYNPENAQAMAQFTVALYQEEQREATKTDVIAGYREGVLTRDEAQTMLLDLRYPDWIAETYLTKADHDEEAERRKEETAAQKEDTSTERDASKGDIIGAYEDGVLTRPEAETFLAALDYNAQVVEVMLARADYRIASRLIKETIATVKELYVSGQIEKPQVYERLNALRLPSTQTEALLQLWVIERERKTKRPSLDQLQEFYSRGIIDSVQLREQVSKLGYLPQYVDWYVLGIDQDVLEAAKKEAERLLKEAERERLSEFSDSRRVALNVLDVSIQECKVYIAESKLAARSIEDPEALTLIADAIAETQVYITQLQLEKLQYPVTPTAIS